VDLTLRVPSDTIESCLALSEEIKKQFYVDFEQRLPVEDFAELIERLKPSLPAPSEITERYQTAIDQAAIVKAAIDQVKKYFDRSWDDVDPTGDKREAWRRVYGKLPDAPLILDFWGDEQIATGTHENTREPSEPSEDAASNALRQVHQTQRRIAKLESHIKRGTFENKKAFYGPLRIDRSDYYRWERGDKRSRPGIVARIEDKIDRLPE
jgi:hypothetical protein